MPKYFSPYIDRFFNNWIRPATWDSMHPADMERFYMFLRILKTYSRKRHWSVGFYDNILKAAKECHPELDGSHVKKMAHFFMEQAETVFAYESARCDPMVAMRNPYAVSMYLRRLEVLNDKGNTRPVYSFEEIEEILAENFGKDWRNQERWK